MGMRMVGFLVFVAAYVVHGGSLIASGHAAHPTTAAEVQQWSMVADASPMPEVIVKLIELGMTTRVHEYAYEPPVHMQSSILSYGYDASSRCSSTSTLFFKEEAVRKGNTFPMYFAPAVTAKLGFLPRHVAQEIPFTASRLTDILALFHIPPDSSEATDVGSVRFSYVQLISAYFSLFSLTEYYSNSRNKPKKDKPNRAVATTLGHCDAPGDTVVCATSPEDLVGRAVAMLGTGHIQALASELPTAGVSLQPYSVRAVKPIIQGSHIVACHSDLYPYSVYRCHLTGQTSTYVMDMESSYANGGALSMVAVCHRNTTSWDPEHIAFKILASKPGGLPICHFVPYGHVTFGKRVPGTSDA